MKELQIHGAFMAWLKKQGLFYIHATFGKKSRMTKDAPDFTVIHCGRALFVECKTEKGALTAGQKTMFAKLQAESGMVVQIARSVEQAVSAVQAWLGVESAAGVPIQSGNGHSGGPPPCRLCGRPPHPDSAGHSYVPKSDAAGGSSLFILNFAGKDGVFTGDPSPGGSVTMVRTATPADLINFPRR